VFVAGRRCTRLGLSRRRSRVRVPSLPPLKAPANQQVALSDRARRVASWPNPVAQTISWKKSAKWPVLEESCVRPHEVHAINRDSRGLRGEGTHEHRPDLSGPGLAHSCGRARSRAPRTTPTSARRGRPESGMPGRRSATSASRTGRRVGDARRPPTSKPPQMSKRTARRRRAGARARASARAFG